MGGYEYSVSSCWRAQKAYGMGMAAGRNGQVPAETVGPREKPLSTFTRGRKRPTFPGSGMGQSPPSTGFLFALRQGYRGTDCTLGAGGSELEARALHLELAVRLSPEHPLAAESSP